MTELDEEKVKAFSYAVKNNYWYQMYIDDLPIWGRVGERGEDKKYYIFTHKKFEIGYNGNRIVDVKLTTEKKQPLVPGNKIKFSYEVNFYPNKLEFKDRFNKYLDPNFFQHRVRHTDADLVFRKMSTDFCDLFFFFSDSLVQYIQ